MVVRSTPGTIIQKMNKLSILLCLCFSLAARASTGNCLPLTFTSLSKIINAPIDYATWYDATFKNGEVKELGEAVDAWNSKETIKLEMYYCNSYYIHPNLSRALQFETGVPYFWVGVMPSGMVAAGEDTKYHSNIVYFTVDGVQFVNTISVGSFYVENTDYATFWSRTVVLYKLSNTSIKFNKLKTN
jgi:hypothetical protein